MNKLLVAAALGHLAGLLGWIDPLYIPLILAGPLIVGAVAASKGLPAAWPAVFWFSAGLSMLWTDWLINREDVAFHAVVSVVTSLLALAGWGLVRLASRMRATA